MFENKMKELKETICYALYDKKVKISPKRRESIIKDLIEGLENKGFEISKNYMWGELTAKIIGRSENEIGFYYKGEIKDNQVTLWERDSKLERFLRTYDPNLKGGKRK
jgi:hypothetical protein